MSITFRCKSCPAEFTVDDKLAGRSGRCKKCGAQFVIPAVAMGGGAQNGPKLALRPQGDSPVAKTAVATSAAANKRPQPAVPSPRAAVASREPQKELALKPASEVPLRLAPANRTGAGTKSSPADRSMGWLNAVNSQLALKPASLENLLAVRLDEELQSDSVSYQPLTSQWAKNRRKTKSSGQGVHESLYRQIFRRAGWALRWLNETAYGISILFVILVCVGYILQATSEFVHPANASNSAATAMSNAGAMETATQVVHAPPKSQHHFITIGISGIVILNLVRIGTGVANLLAIVFRQSPTQGILFLIPPMMFVYIRSHWNQVRKPVRRIIEPVITLVVVVAAYMLIPGLGRPQSNANNVRDRVQGAVKSLKSDVSGGVKSVQQNVKSLETNLPHQIDEAQKTFEGLQEKVQKAIETPAEPDKDAAKQAPQN
jgi:hypothetical protein